MGRFTRQRSRSWGKGNRRFSISCTFGMYCIHYDTKWLTHWGRVTHICVGKLNHHWFKWWLVAWSAPSHYLNQCWNIVNSTLRNKLQWNLNRKSNIFIEENTFENVVCEMVSITINTLRPDDTYLHLWFASLLVQVTYAVALHYLNTLRPRQNGRYVADEIFKCIFLNENAWISIKISLKFVPKVRINNIPALVLIMAWRRPGGKPLSEPMMVSLLTHTCVTRSQWVNQWWFFIDMHIRNYDSLHVTTTTFIFNRSRYNRWAGTPHELVNGGMFR